MNTYSIQSLQSSPAVALSIAYSGMDDAELIALCKRHDQAAFQTLLKRHQRAVYARLYKLAPDWNDTADLAQEVFIKMWRGIDKLQNPNAFKSWMIQIINNLFYDEIRKRSHNLNIMSLDQPMYGEDESESATRDIPDPSAGPDEIYDRKVFRASVDAAIAKLPRQFRTAIILREVEDLPYDEIAKITNTEVGTVKSRIARARLKVQKVLRPQFYPGRAA